MSEQEVMILAGHASFSTPHRFCLAIATDLVIGRIRSAVERGHAFLSQFGRIVRRLDRIVLRYLGWVQLAACMIFIRAGFSR